MPLDFHGLDLTHPVNRIPSGRVSIAQNVRAYFSGGVSFRNLLTGALYTVAAALHTIRRLNDSTPNGPPSGYTLINGAAAVLYANATSVATGLSGNPVSMVPFRPNASVQPWMYVADSAAMGAVTLATKYLGLTLFGPAGTPVNFSSNGMMKVRSDGLVYKMGIEEPQLAPVVSTSNSNLPFGGGTGNLLATTIPWTNYPIGTNSSFNYGETNGPPKTTPPPLDGTPPFIVNVANATTVTINTLTGTATINGGSRVPTDSSSAWVASGAPGYPGQFIQVGGVTATTASVVIGAFTDGAGNVLPLGVAPLYVTSVVDVGANIGVAIPVPSGAQLFQIGINSQGDTYSSNSGAFSMAGTVTTNALPAVTAILGTMTLFYWGDSPTSGPVGSYIWKNPDDPGGSGPARSTSNAVGSTTGNSFIFDATFTGGLPGLPGIGSPSTAMQWTTLNSDSVAMGTNPVFAAPITATYPSNTQFTNFNFCLTGSIYFPAAGNYSFVLTNHDDVIWGIGGGVTLVSATKSGSGEGSSTGISSSGQTITVVGGYPLLPRQNYTSGSGGNYAQTTVVVSVSAAGIYPIEIDYDYWYHSGRILLLDASPTPGAGATIIPPLTQGVREEVQYRHVYRSSATGAVSNPSPESTAESVPVTANTITSFWSNDPQVDVVDYYRIDSALTNFIYVCTGPNDNLGGGGTNTPVSDSASDTAIASNPILQFDNYEPFPSIDLPQKGICSVSGGVVTWVSGGAIGGTATGFNVRWLAGTEILIGSPTALAYTFVARPTSASSVTIPEVPDGTNLVYEIPEPILAAQPMPYMWGPTDNINFVFAVGDPLRPGTLYWCKGSNLDSAPDTNQMDVTDPGEPLVNGAMSGGRGVLFSIQRAWVIMPNFFNALATVTGTTGSTWTLQATSINRGLFMPRCVAIEGGGLIFFRVDDGIHLSPGGGASKSITDQDLYPIFPHENEDGGTSVPQSVTREGVTIYPPDDSQPQKQKFSIVNGYLYYDYAYNFGGNQPTASVEFSPTGGETVGAGIPWQNPASAVDSPILPVTANITGWSAASNVITFHAINNFSVDEWITPTGLTAGFAFNYLSFQVLSSGLSSSQFQVSVYYTDTALTADSGTATPTLPNYASVALPAPPVTPNPGEFVTFVSPTSFTSPQIASSGFLGMPMSATAVAWSNGGTVASSGGGPFLGWVVASWAGFVPPTLPAGATITRILPIVQADGAQPFPSNALTFFNGPQPTTPFDWPVNAPGGPYITDMPGGAFSGQYTLPSIGSNSAAISGAQLNFAFWRTLGPAYAIYWADITQVQIAVYYTVSGGSPESGQAQVLELTGTRSLIPSDAIITGIELNLASGTVLGSAIVETAQLTVAGTPVGTFKTLNPGAWPTSYLLGGDQDLWGQESMTGAEANTMDVNFSADLNPGSQLNLNDVSLTVYYRTNEQEEGAATLVFDIQAMGWVWDMYTPTATIHAANEGVSQQGVLVGCSDGTIRQLASGGTETATAIVQTPAFGGRGWQTTGPVLIVEYSSSATITLTGYAADADNGSYAPPTITIPSSGGALTKLKLVCGPSKWKLLWFQFSSTAQFQLNLEGFVVQARDWGTTGPFREVQPFGESGGAG